jgi:hypothetical protein
MGVPRVPSGLLPSVELESFQPWKDGQFLFAEDFNCLFTRDFDFLVSGDYKGATDNLNIEVSQTIWDRLKVHLSIGDRSHIIDTVFPFLDMSLFGMMVCYPKLFNQYVYDNRETKFQEWYDLWSYGAIENPDGSRPFQLPSSGLVVDFSDFGIRTWQVVRVQMLNGQLMGSILSFPLLCLANFSCYVKTLKEYVKIMLDGRFPTKRTELSEDLDLLFENSIFLSSLPVLINGDDISFRASENFYNLWLKNLPEFGFKPSQGKNYISSVMVTLNSEVYLPQSRTTVGYLNVGLLRGPDSGLLGARQSSLTDMPLSDFFNLSVVPSNNPSRSLRRFIHYNLPIIKRITRGGKHNLFLPSAFGGLDFVPIPEANPKLSPLQISLAEGYRRLYKTGDDQVISDLNDLKKAFPTVSFSLDSKLKSFPSTDIALTRAGVFKFLKPFDVLPEHLAVIQSGSSPPLIQPGTFLSELKSRNGHYVHPSDSFYRSLMRGFSSSKGYSIRNYWDMIPSRPLLVKVPLSTGFTA